ncbi:efflux RND transporter periplasmic adaptor subunit [Williamwhitmania taraxaci]|uniref:RND family efflux transporter, MFP subunit n=1 Tax=Williamwhitmania taraxaci TaxID=1640674 RepID=A0A1G6NJX6_9BACT|nr:efflux RND transporter periplasmic adaptor subunit [Williamwhitmania taraxaci]SDC67435.1 RND family efflux transporter, MFP subunit [Williamwhitmania taraxaci]
MKNRVSIILIAIAFTAISCNNNEPVRSNDPEIPVSVSPIVLSSIEELINTNGTVYPMQKAEFKSEITGAYTLRNNPATGRQFRLGDKVTANNVVISIEDAEFENSIAIDSKKLNLDLAEQEFRKQESLFEKGGVTQRELRNSEVNFTNAKYDYKNAQLKLAKMKVNAPFSGILVELPYYTQGVQIAAGQPLFTVMDFGKMYMEINLPEKYISQIKQGFKVRLTSYNLPNDTLWGTITDISPAISAETRTFKGRVEIGNSKLQLKPGMFVNADIILSQKKNTIVIPKELIMRNNDVQYVFVVDKRIAHQKEILLGIENANKVEIVSGISKDDRLVVKGYETLKDNSKVKVIR